MTVYHIFGMTGAIALVLTLLRYFISKPSSIVVAYLQYFVGSLFIFSGFVKAVDPLGTSYKMHEYFEAFAGEGMRPMWEWLAGFSTFFAITMIALELFVGFMLLIGWKPKLTVTIIWWLTLFFTILTGYTFLSGYAITKPFMLMAVAVSVAFAVIPLGKDSAKRTRITVVASLLLLSLLIFFFSHKGSHPFVETGMKVTDCGCFGDFIKLKPWETFYKDLILDAMILVLVLGIKHIRPIFNEGVRTGLAATTGVASLALCLYTVYFNEPVIDFRPYAVGSDIIEARTEKKPATIEMLFVYKNKKSGEVKEYTTAELTGLNYDEIEFVERKDKIVDPGIPAKIINLRIENDEGVDITDTLLSDDNYSLMVVSYNMKKSDKGAFTELNEIAKGAEKAGVDFYMVTVDDGKLEELRHKYQLAFPFYNADETPLKTIIRSNPGLVLFKHGVVVNKWHHKHLPTSAELEQTYFKK